MMNYRRLCKGLNDRGKLIPTNANVLDYIDDDSDYYLSTFKYSEDQKKQFETTGTISGITDVVTNLIYFDFDSEVEPEIAKQNTIALVRRLQEYYDTKDIVISFSGNKGFGVELNVQEDLTPKQVKQIAFQLAEGLPHFDVKMYNASRILRILGTRHQKTGLYKVPLTFAQLEALSLDEIMDLARHLPEDNVSEFRWNVVSAEPFIKVKFESAPSTDIKDDFVAEIDFSKKAKGWTNCKWSLLNGNFKEGERHYPVLAIIATCRNLNYPKETAYYMAKSACKLSVQRFGGTEFPKEEIWSEVESVYNDNWQGGTFSCKDGKSPWLTSICGGLGVNKCKHEEKSNFVEVTNAFETFQQFAQDIEKNTIKTGIRSLDQAVRLRTGQMVGILGAPSSGKTSLALEILENTSKSGLLSVFYSLDMSAPELFQKIAQRVTGYTDNDLYRIFQNHPQRQEEIRQKVLDTYKNVKFCFDTGVSVENIETAINEFQEATGKKVKLLMLDYNELLSSPYSDQTASSGHNAGQLKKLTNANQVCTISLLQPPKVIGDASDELTSYRNIKGSSLLEQCFSIIVGIYRPGFTPKNNSEDDKFLVMNVLKNRLGKLISLMFKWEGIKGQISELSDFDAERLNELIEAKRREAASKAF